MMKNIRLFIKWIFSTWRNFLLASAYIIAAYLFVCLIINYHIIEEEKAKVQEIESNLDPLLHVRGQSIYIGDDEVYKFIPVSGGNLVVPDSNNRRVITVNSFLIGEIEVSNRLLSYVLRREQVPEGSAEKIMDFPANNGTKEDWLGFIEKLNKMTGHTFRLPTNDEWEFAARGGKASMGYIYSGSNNIDAVALYKGNTRELGNVASRLKKPNELGLYDMSGSQWELTSTTIPEVDYKLATFYKELAFNKESFKEQYPNDYEEIMREVENPSLVARGGAWNSPAEDCLLNYTPTVHYIKTGARLVMEK